MSHQTHNTYQTNSDAASHRFNGPRFALLLQCKGSQRPSRVFKKEIIRKALNTSDPDEAVRKVRSENLQVHAEFEN